MTKPVLSIGIIFKNEIRCIERCLKSLQPLREAIPCELVMADTGSEDGSRAVAEQYADILFDFPWINDFSAARNAVMDRCSGAWYMSIDCDEWLDADFAQLLQFLAVAKEGDNYAAVTIRNYKSEQLENGGMYGDFSTGRLMRMSTGIRYTGLIHERWDMGSASISLLERVIFHHDGYVYADAEAAKVKTERNMGLLKQELENDPDSLLLLMQCIESDGGETPEYTDYVYRGVEGVKEKRQGWQMFGASIIRHAVMAATVKNLPELDEWIAMAEEWFPDSVFTRIDVQYLAMGQRFNKEDYLGAICRGDAYFRAMEDFKAGNYNRTDLLCGTLGMDGKFWRQSAQLFMAAAYLMERQPEQCLELLRGLDATIMDMKQVKDSVRNFTHLYSRSMLDTEPVLTAFWDSLTTPKPSQEKADARKAEFIRLACDVFHPVYRDGETREGDFCRHAYGVFLPLAGKCVLGDAARMLETREPAQLEALLAGLDDLETLPPYVLTHALRCGAEFPLPGRPLAIEKMDAFISGIAKEEGELFALVRQAAENIPDHAQGLAWVRGLCMAALKACEWKKEDEEPGLFLARTFARVERMYLPLCYAPGALDGENLFLLPPMHRFGWYCAQAFDVLDGGDAAGYVRLLREGLRVCEGVKDMVEFLLNNTPELNAPSDELKAMAEQIRAVLANFSPDDPAVAALKQSEVYQKVAYLIEQTD